MGLLVYPMPMLWQLLNAKSDHADHMLMVGNRLATPNTTMSAVSGGTSFGRVEAAANKLCNMDLSASSR